MDSLSDMELVREYAATDSDEVFAELVRRHINLVYSVALRRLADPHQAEEVTQAVFTILAKKAAGLRAATILPGWLYQTAQLTAANFQRSAIRRQHREQEALMQFAQETEPDDSWRRLQPLLEDAMARLGDKERDAVVLRFFENRTVGEVAVALNVKEAAAQKRVNRATEKLRKFFLRRGVPVSAGVLVAAIGANSVQAAPVGLAATVAGAAVLKGAAATVSTLTLIQGTLKIMAWSKLKTSVVVGVAVLLTAGVGVATVKTVQHIRTAHSPNLEGAWEGALEANGGKLRLVLKLNKTNGIYIATVDSIDQAAKDLKVDSITYEYPSFKLEMKSLGATYQAKLNPGATEISGNWKQLGTMPLTLTRTTEPDVVADPLTPAEYAPRKGSDLQGLWKTEMKINNQTMPMDLKISEPTAGNFRVEGTSAAIGMSFPASLVVYERPTLTVEFGGAAGIFEGKLDNGNTQISGTFKFGGQPYPAVFKRGDAFAQETRDVTKDFSHNGPNDLPGHWSGALNVKGVVLRLQLNIAKMPDGGLEGSLVSVDQGGAVIPSTVASFTAPKAHLEWKGIGGSFTGELKNGKLAGTWKQGGMALPLTFERTNQK